MLSDFLRISPKIACLPIIHGSGDYAIEVRRRMLAADFDCLAVPLPPSFQEDVERAVELLPSISAVLQDESRVHSDDDSSSDEESAEDDSPSCSYVPIDPCQGVIAGLRIALQEQIPRAFVDRETAQFEPQTRGPARSVRPQTRVSRKILGSRAPRRSRPPRRQQHRQRCVTMASPASRVGVAPLVDFVHLLAHGLALDPRRVS